MQRGQHPRREFTLPQQQFPTAALQPQATTSKRCFVACSGDTFLSISGGFLVKCNAQGQQELRAGRKSRSFSCLVVSPCGTLLAAGEGCCAGNRSSQVAVFNWQSAQEPTFLPAVPRRSIRQLAWIDSGSQIAGVTDADQEQGGEQLLVLWSWPRGERLAMASCGRGLLELCGSAYASMLVTIGPCGPKTWFASPQETFLDVSPSTKSGHISYRLVGRPLPIGTLGSASRQCQAGGGHGRSAPARLFPGRRTSHEDGPGRRRPADDVFVSAAWGRGRNLFLATRQGMLSCVEDDRLKRSLSLGQRAHCLAWSPTTSGEFADENLNECGLLACALAGGRIKLIDASSLTVIAALNGPSTEGSTDATVVSFCADGAGLFALYADRSVAYWKRMEDAPTLRLQAAVPSFRDVACLCMPGTEQVVTMSDRLHVWRKSTSATNVGGFCLHVESPSTWRNDLTALAASEVCIATGSANGEVRLYSPQFKAFEPLQMRHSSEVHILSFGAWTSGSSSPLLLASASRDRCAIVFRIGGVADGSAGSATMLLYLSRLPSDVQCLALLVGCPRHGFAEDVAHLALCTTDRQLAVRELLLTPTAATVGKVNRHQAVGLTRWVGVVANPVRPCLVVASSDRRLIETDALSCKILQETRLVGCGGGEFVAPVRITGDGRHLAVCLAGHGVLLIDLDSRMEPTRLLVTGQGEMPLGLALLPNSCAIACWSQGSLLAWPTVDVQAAASSHLVEGDLAITPRDEPRTAAMSPSPNMVATIYASSPKPPPWSTEGSRATRRREYDEAGEDRGFEVQRSSSQPLSDVGRWARNSKVGSLIITNLREYATPDEGSSCGPSGAQVRAASEGFPVRRSLFGCAYAESCAGASSASSNWRPKPLPPMPVFPPPESSPKQASPSASSSSSFTLGIAGEGAKTLIQWLPTPSRNTTGNMSSQFQIFDPQIQRRSPAEVPRESQKACSSDAISPVQEWNKELLDVGCVTIRMYRVSPDADDFKDKVEKLEELAVHALRKLKIEAKDREWHARQKAQYRR